MERLISLLERLLQILIMLFHGIASTILLVAFYFIKSSYIIINVDKPYGPLLNYITYIIFTFILSGISLLMMLKISSNDSINNNVIEITPVNNEYLPIYLGYIFVSLGIPNSSEGCIDWITLLMVYVFITLFVTFSRSLCFNPIFVIFGYGYYSVKTQRGVKVFIITRKKINKNDLNPNFHHLRKITELIYIEK